MQIESKTYDNGKYKYQYLDFGEGENTILFFHGLMANKEAMSNLAHKFSRLGRCLVFDLPGHNNIPTYNATDVQTYADYFHTFINEHKLTNIILFGFSFGGLVTLTLSRTIDRNKVKGLIVWDSPILPFEQSVTKAVKVGYVTFKLMPQKVYQSVISPPVLETVSRLTRAPIDEDDREAICKTPQDTVLKMRKLIDSSVLKLPKDIHALFLYGDKDVLISKKCYETLHNGIPDNCEVSCIEGAGHFGTKEGWDTAVKR